MILPVRSLARIAIAQSKPFCSHHSGQPIDILDEGVTHDSQSTHFPGVGFKSGWRARIARAKHKMGTWEDSAIAPKHEIFPAWSVRLKQP